MISPANYFPILFPDEILYSVLARLRHHCGTPTVNQTIIGLFGKTYSKGLDLPRSLGALTRRLPPGRNITSTELAERHTLFRYHTAFATPAMRRRVLGEMITGNAPADRTKYLVPRTNLRFCPECLVEMRRNFGEIYWRCAHQLPAVLVCPDHGVPLCVSDVPAARVGGNLTYVAAEAALVPGRIIDAPRFGRETIDGLKKLADSSVALLLGIGHRNAPIARMLEQHQSVLRRKGFMATRVAANFVKLRPAASELLGFLRPVWPQLFEEDGLCGRWLQGMVRSESDLMDTTLELFLQTILEGLPEGYRDPFGKGPWPCVNPLAPHRGQTTIKVQTTKPRRPCMRVHTCPECGYSYSTSVRDDGSLTNPFVHDFGNLLREHVIRSSGLGWSVRKIAMAAEITPETLVIAARKMEMTLPPRRKMRAKGLPPAPSVDRNETSVSA